MTHDEIEAALARTLEDRRLSRAEREGLGPLLETLAARVGPREVRRRAFDAAKAALSDPAAREVVGWLEGVLKLLDRHEGAAPKLEPAEAHFSPGDHCWTTIVRLLSESRTNVDICVFTITDDRLSEAIVAAHKRGVAVRVVTDDEKATDPGSDVGWFEQEGIPVRVDRTQFHMHHKFAVFDGARLLSGSYNWTRGAARDNDENFIVVSDPRLIGAFCGAFEQIWGRLGD
jgi:mitochondrial cardiolipin hydrolase